MKVKDIIAGLSKANPESEVYIEIMEPYDEGESVTSIKIEISENTECVTLS